MVVRADNFLGRFRNFQKSRTRVVRSRLGLVYNEHRIAKRFRFTHRPVPRYFSIQKVLRPDRVQVQVEQESGQVCVRSTCLSVSREFCLSSWSWIDPPFFSNRLNMIKKVFIHKLWMNTFLIIFKRLKK